MMQVVASSSLRLVEKTGFPVALLAATADTSVLFAACAIFGFTIGNLIIPVPLLRWFMGLSTAASGTVGALGPGLIGLVRSCSDGYEAALALFLMLELVAAVIVLMDHHKGFSVTSRSWRRHRMSS
jgi:cyanate permease